ncbi:alpha/beta fold hydrolase [Streptomyces sp. DT7]
MTGRGTRRLPRGPWLAAPSPSISATRGDRESNKPYGTELFALDVVAVLDYLGIDGADVYGTSMGGRLAQQLEARHPHRVRALKAVP